MKPIIRLFDSVGLGLIIAWPSAVMISNQTGGTSCLQPELEGVFVPIRNDQSAGGIHLSPELGLRSYFEGSKYNGSGATTGIDDKDADFIDAVLDRAGLNTAVKVDRSRLADSHEAWVHVIIMTDESEDADLALFASFNPYPRSGVLTWSNGD